MAELILNSEERELIDARRKQQAERELKAREDAAIPDILQLTEAQYHELPAEKRAAMWRYAMDAAQQR